MKYQSIIVLIIVLCFTSCNTYRTKYRLNRMMSSSIELPDNLIKVGPDSSSIYHVSKLPKLIIWIDSTECSSCRLSQLDVYSSLYNCTQKELLCKIVVIISPKKAEKEYVASLAGMYACLPVYIDTNNKFYRLNKHIPHD